MKKSITGQELVRVVKNLLIVNKILALQLFSLSMRNPNASFDDVDTFRQLHDELSDLEREVFGNEKK